MSSKTSSSLAAVGSLAVVAAVHAAYFYLKAKDEKAKQAEMVGISLPTWAKEYEESFKNVNFTNDNQRMNVAVELSAQNVKRNTGGPFGCAIFEQRKDGTCQLFSIGINQVVPLSNSTLHGEMVAIQFAQKKLKKFSMRGGDNEYLMYSSCEPCAMCLGGTLWSGVSELACAAAKPDAEAIGFNEGPVFEESYKQLETAGVKVKRNVLRKEGAEVLRKYGETGVIYNG